MGWRMTISWRIVLLNLRHAGLPTAEVARKVGMSTSGLLSIANGEALEPRRFEVCLRLLDLHLDHCPERHTLEALKA